MEGAVWNNDWLKCPIKAEEDILRLCYYNLYVIPIMLNIDELEDIVIIILR